MAAKRQHTGLTAVAGDAAEALRTIQLDASNGMDRASSVGFSVAFTPGAAGDTVLSVHIYKSADEGATWARVPAWTDYGSGTFVGSDYTAQVTFAAAGNVWIDADMRNANAVKAVFSTDTADAADALSVCVCSDYQRS